MNHIVPLSLFAAIALLAQPQSASSCSIVSDYADGPGVEQDYDPLHAPIAPKIVDAYVSHNYHSKSSPCVSSTCGDIHGLSIDIETKSDRSAEILRIAHEDGTVAYARLPKGSGEHHLFLPGYEDVAQTIDIKFAIVDGSGYPSSEVSWATSSEDSYPGCSTSDQTEGVFSCLLVALAIVLSNRKHQYV